MITSTTNPLVKELVRLRSRRHRDAAGRFVVEGARNVERAIASGTTIIQQIVAPELGGQPADTALATTELAEGPFRKVSARQNPDGVMVVAAQLETHLERLDPPPDCLLLVVESVEKPGNLGAMFRTCDALGADAVLVADPATDIHNPNVVQSSQGALFTVPTAVASTGQVIAWLRHRSITLVGLTPAADEELWDVDLTGPIAVAIGSESVGLSAEMLEAATPALITMAGTVDSLNASVTAALALYEATRQRRQV